ncbi:probable G-protein coupled receptor Mth-like 11 [Drosophila nasuta]|uniref:probable G-protein coupled receptor Mth-like 11 n=1 Tax=Drosophila nasuta TaxID=42062 RepID=UPI00295E611A|nr:probable G-protein coupled receptor Mth-like 11 [Drosophila nasuta]
MKNHLRVFLIFGIFYIFQGCDYFDTVDLTNSIKFDNGSYQYEDVLIPKEKTREYDYQILFNGDYETVPKHIRGCVCHLKTCIRFCCYPKQLLLKDINDLEFIVQQHLPVPCHDHKYLEPDNPDHAWTLYENGKLLRHFDSALLTKQDYCFQPRKCQGLYKLVPYHCVKPPDRSNAYLQLVSIFFLLMVIIVYLILPNFKGDYFKCCICYFSCLTLSSILLVIVRCDWINLHQKVLCLRTGYIGYYFVISTFLWLLIINYDLWKTFNNIGISHGSKLYKYNIFAWGVAAVQLLLTLFVDFVIGNSSWSPNVGKYLCWIDVATWSSIIYYYGPISIYLTLNTKLFIITASKIFFRNRTNRRQLTQSERQRNLRTLTNFGTFFRLFVIMGVFWIFEIISYFGYTIFDISMKFNNMITCCQGITLFVATILKRDVLKALANRLRIGNTKIKMPHQVHNISQNGNCFIVTTNSN